MLPLELLVLILHLSVSLRLIELLHEDIRLNSSLTSNRPRLWQKTTRPFRWHGEVMLGWLLKLRLWCILRWFFGLSRGLRPLLVLLRRGLQRGVRCLGGHLGGLFLFGSYRLELQLGVLELLLELIVGLSQSLAVLLF